MILNSLVTSGEAAKLGANAILVYLILKVHADYHTGLVSIGVRRLSQLSGIKSYQTVSNALKKLVQHSLIKSIDKEKGLRGLFEVKDTVTLYDREGTEAGKAVVPYQPMQMKKHIDDVKLALKTGELPSSSNVTLNLNIVVTNGNNNTLNINNINVSSDENNSRSYNLDDLPVSIRSFLEKVMKKDG